MLHFQLENGCQPMENVGNVIINQFDQPPSYFYVRIDGISYGSQGVQILLLCTCREDNGTMIQASTSQGSQCSTTRAKAP